MVPHETEKYALVEQNGRLAGYEKDHTVAKDDRTVLVQQLEPEHLEASVASSFDAINAQSALGKGNRAAIKINLGGGIHHVPCTYSHPAICEAVIKAVRDLGCEPFVCEADMRGHLMNERMLKIRGYTDILERNDVGFVNLSRIPSVRLTCRDLDIPLDVPALLLEDEVRIISFAPPKHHWECGITCSQKNMYGAVSDQRKSTYHRKYGRIDAAVAAAARMLSPDINVLAAFDLGAGLGPHFCIPITFNRMIISKDMLAGDKAASEILGYPFSSVRYAMLNTGGSDIDYELHPDSHWPDEETLTRIKSHSIGEGSVKVWKPALYLQYFVPHAFQIAVYPHFEFIMTWINKLFFRRVGHSN